jgi:hypothetical protein
MKMNTRAFRPELKDSALETRLELAAVGIRPAVVVNPFNPTTPQFNGNLRAPVAFGGLNPVSTYNPTTPNFNGNLRAPVAFGSNAVAVQNPVFPYNPTTPNFNGNLRAPVAFGSNPFAAFSAYNGFGAGNGLTSMNSFGFAPTNTALSFYNFSGARTLGGVTTTPGSIFF